MMWPPHTAHVRVMSRLVRTVCRGTPLSNVMSTQACKSHTSLTMSGSSYVVTLLQLRTRVAAGAARRTLHVRYAPLQKCRVSDCTKDATGCVMLHSTSTSMTRRILVNIALPRYYPPPPNQSNRVESPC